MKITDVKVETIRIPMKKPFRIAFAVQDHSLNVLVKISPTKVCGASVRPRP